MSKRWRNDDGMALVTVIILSSVIVGLGILMITVALRANENTTAQRIRENAFQAADAGVSDAISCLIRLTPTSFSSGVSDCNDMLDAPSDRTQLTDDGRNIGQYDATVTECLPPSDPDWDPLGCDKPEGESDNIVQIVANGYGPQISPTPGGLRSERRIVARVRLEPIGGFLYTLFAGGTSPSGNVEIKNGAIVNGSVYAGGATLEKNNNRLGAVEVVGDFTTKNGDTYESIWSGGDVTLGQASVTLDVRVCGDPDENKGNINFDHNGAHVGGNLTYRGDSLGRDPSNHVDGSINDPTNFCQPPPERDLPVFTWDRDNYHEPNFSPSQKVLEFTDAAAARDCLTETDIDDQTDTDKCGAATMFPSSGAKQLGDEDETLGSDRGTVVYVNDPGCPGAAVMTLDDDWTIKNDFTLVTNCKIALEGTWTYSDEVQGSSQVLLYTSSSTGSADLEITKKFISPGEVDLLLFTTGSLEAQNNPQIGSGSLYGDNISVVNNLNIQRSAALADTPPPGFDFSDSAVRFEAILERWAEEAA